MELYIEKDELINGLNHVQGIVEKRSTNPILSNVLIVAKDDGITLTATNTEVTYIGELSSNVISAGSITVDGHHLFQIARSMPDSTIHMKLGNQSRVEITSGSAWFKMLGRPAEDYPPVTHFTEGNTIVLKSRDLKHMVDQCSFSIASEDNRYGINGSHLEVVEETGQPMLRMVATDGHRLSYAGSQFSGDFLMPKRMLIPRKAMSELRKLCDASDTDVKISFSESGALVTLPKSRFFFRLIDGEFPEYRKVVPSNNNKVITISKDLISGALKRVGLLASNQARPVRFSFEGNSLTISTNNIDIGESKEEISIESTGGDITLGFNARYFLDVLSVIKSENINIELGESVAAAVIKSPGDNDGLFVIMPMRID